MGEIGLILGKFKKINRLKSLNTKSIKTKKRRIAFAQHIKWPIGELYPKSLTIFKELTHPKGFEFFYAIKKKQLRNKKANVCSFALFLW